MSPTSKKPVAWVGAARRPRLLGRYHVLDELGRNAVGPLYIARLEGPKGFQRWAAIRIVDKRHLTEAGYVQRFYERVREGAKLLHPNVAALFDADEDDGSPWVAMEYLHGERLEEMIERLEFADTPASWEIAARIISDAAEGLHALHNLRDKEGKPLGLLHGDLAPHSLVVTYEGKTKIKGAFEPRAHGVLDPRKVPYAAPEQLFDGIVDARADVFALGVLLWELLAGRRLFGRATDAETRAMIEAGVIPPLAQFVAEVPVEVDELVRRSLTRSPAQRFASARELSRELESLLVSKGVVARDDDVGRYMRTLFADRFKEQESRLQAVSDVTEVFRRSKQPAGVRSVAAIPDLSVKDDEAEETELMQRPLLAPAPSDDDHTTAERRVAKPPLSLGYTDEITADSGPTNPRERPLHDTDEIPTVTAPHPTLKSRGEEVTLTGPQPTPLVPTDRSTSRLVMPTSMRSEHDDTESAIFVAPRTLPLGGFAPTPPDGRTPTPPPRPMMPSFPERPLLPSTPPTGVAPWPPAPPVPPPFTPPNAFGGVKQMTSRGPHNAMSTTSLRAVLFPQDRTKRIAVVSILGSIGGAVLFLVFFLVWRMVDHSTVTQSPTTASTARTPVARSTPPPPPSAAPSVTVAPIPTFDLQPTTTTTTTTTITRPRRNATGSRSQPVLTTQPVVTPASGKTGFLTVMCKAVSCDHIIDAGRDLGNSPLYRQELSAGKHVLTLRVDKSQAQKTVTVDVPDGENVTIRPDLTQ